ncbi:MAG: glycoside hydrolase family 1 protein [Anaerolineales bacterium]
MKSPKLSATYHFPRGFLWGTATAAHQVEGNNTNNQWWAWEQGGHTDGTSGLACDWWGGRWREDFDRAAESGQSAHRLSVEWSRIQPSPDRWDQDAIEHYRTMLRGLRDRGMTAMVTLHHFTDPLWLTELGAWETEAVVPLFERFAERVVEALKEYCTLWCTINEPNVYAILGYVTGNMPPGTGGLRKAVTVQANMVRAHAAAFRAIHRIQPEARVGYALHYRPMLARRRWFPPDVILRRVVDRTFNLAFPSAISTGVLRSPVGNARVAEATGTQDYCGLNYYTRPTVWFDLSQPQDYFAQLGNAPGDDLSEHAAIANIPRGLYDSIAWLVRSYPDVPIIITENGVESTDDSIRPRYIAQHLHQVWRAVNFNWQVKGYLHWTLVDNFEWERGWSHRFGLWALDEVTQKRSKRPSADLYADICRTNSLSAEMVERYCPEVYDKIFPPFDR